MSQRDLIEFNFKMQSFQIVFGFKTNQVALYQNRVGSLLIKTLDRNIVHQSRVMVAHQRGQIRQCLQEVYTLIRVGPITKDVPQKPNPVNRADRSQHGLKGV